MGREKIIHLNIVWTYTRVVCNYRTRQEMQDTYAMMVLMTISLIFSQMRVVLIPWQPKYCHSAFKALY